MAPIACTMALCVACGAASNRAAPAALGGICMLTAGLMLLASCICILVQFFVGYDNQVVYNPWETNTYITIDGTLIDYLNGNYYMKGWGAIVTTVFAFLIIMAVWVITFAVIVLVCNDHTYSARPEWSAEAIRYTRKARAKGSAGRESSTAAPPGEAQAQPTVQ
jgi:intracellular septation protein A